MIEVWKPVVGYEGFYEVSNFGLVRSVEHLCETYHGKRIVPSKILKINHNVWGYQNVCLCKLGIKKTVTVHSLVANSFLGYHDTTEDWEVNHKDGNKDNNRVENLEWVTCTQNKWHAINTGLLKPRGEDNGNSKLTTEDVRQIRFLSKFMNYPKLAKLFGVDRANIGLIVRRINWGHAI